MQIALIYNDWVKSVLYENYYENSLNEKISFDELNIYESLHSKSAKLLFNNSYVTKNYVPVFLRSQKEHNYFNHDSQIFEKKSRFIFPN